MATAVLLLKHVYAAAEVRICQNSPDVGHQYDALKVAISEPYGLIKTPPTCEKGGIDFHVTWFFHIIIAVFVLEEVTLTCSAIYKLKACFEYVQLKRYSSTTDLSHFNFL